MAVDNPFTVGGPIRDPKRFIGRVESLETLFSGLRSGSSYQLVGGRQTGKSSVLAMLQRRDVQRHYEFQPPPDLISVECEEIREPVDEDAVWRHLLKALSVVPDDDDPYEGLKAVLGGRRNKLAFLLDEFDFAHRPELGAGFFHRLRVLASHHCQFVFALEGDLKDWEATGTTSPLHNLPVRTPVTVFSPEEVHELLSRLEALKGSAPKLIEVIAENVGYHPYLVQAVCSAAYAKGVYGGTLLKNVARTVRANVEDWWESLRPAERELLYAAIESGLNEEIIEANQQIVEDLADAGWLVRPSWHVPKLLRTIVTSSQPSPKTRLSCREVLPKTNLVRWQPVEVRQFLSDIGSFSEKVGCRTDTLIERVKWSRRLLANLAERCHAAFGEGNDSGHFTIGVCGSVGRLEAGPHSDLDTYIVFDDENFDHRSFPEVRRKATEILGTLRQFLPSDVDLHAYKQPATRENAGTFPVAFRVSSLRGTIGSQEDLPELVTRRLCILTESQPVYHPKLFEAVRAAVAQEYSVQEGELINKPPEAFLLEFRSWCFSFRIREIARSVREGEAGRELNWTKLSHHRALSHAAMLWEFAVLRGQGTTHRRLLEAITSPPLLKAARLAAMCCNDPKLSDVAPLLAELLSCYNDSLKALGSHEVRRGMRGQPMVKETLSENGHSVRRCAREILVKLIDALAPHDRRDFLGALLL